VIRLAMLQKHVNMEPVYLNKSDQLKRSHLHWIPTELLYLGSPWQGQMLSNLTKYKPHYVTGMGTGLLWTTCLLDGPTHMHIQLMTIIYMILEMLLRMLIRSSSELEHRTLATKAQVTGPMLY